MRRREWLSLPAAALAGCARSKEKAERRVLRLGMTPHLTMAPIYLAKEKGFFAAENLEVEFVPFTNSREILPLLSEGKVDAAFIAFSAALVNLISRGARIRIVAAREQFSMNCGDQGALYLSNERFPKGDEDPAAWRGARGTLTGRATYHEFLFRKIEEHVGLERGSVQLKVMRNEEAFAAASAGQLDVLTGAARPGHGRAEFMGRFRRSDIGERLLPNFQYSYTLFGPALVDGETGAGTRLLRAYLRGAEAFVAGETPAFVGEYAKKMGLDAEKLRAECRRGTSTTGEIREADLQAMLDWAAEKKDVERRLLAKDMIDPRFLAGVKV